MKLTYLYFNNFVYRYCLVKILLKIVISREKLYTYRKSFKLGGCLKEYDVQSSILEPFFNIITSSDDIRDNILKKNTLRDPQLTAVYQFNHSYFC